MLNPFIKCLVTYLDNVLFLSFQSKSDKSEKRRHSDDSEEEKKPAKKVLPFILIK